MHKWRGELPKQLCIMRYAISITNALAERRSHPNLMHFRNYALLPYALLKFRLYFRIRSCDDMGANV